MTVAIHNARLSSPRRFMTAGLLCLALLAAPLPVAAQGNPGATGAGIVFNMSAGTMTAEQGTAHIINSGNISIADANSLVSAMTSTSNLDRETKARVVDAVMGGSLHPQVAIGLMQSSNLGNINGADQLAAVFNNSNIQQGLQKVGAQLGAGGLAQHMGLVADIAANFPLSGNLAADPAAMANFVASVANNVPALVAAAGGEAALATATKAVTDSIGILSPPPGGFDGVNGVEPGSYPVPENANTGGQTTPPPADTGQQQTTPPADTGQQQTTTPPSTAEKAQNNSDGCSSCCCPCTQPIINNHKRIRRHVDILGNDKEQSEFEEHRKWMALTFFQEHILRAMMMMTSQLTAVGVEQVRQIGNFLDAKHQLETQRLFQRLSVQAHKDYQPSEGICEIGTISRSLLASERRTDLAKMALAQHALKRTLGSGDIVSVTGGVSDKLSRLKTFVEKHCDINDNSKGLKNLCQKSAPKKNRNSDIDYVRTIESKLTLDIDFTKAGEDGAFMMPGDGGLPVDENVPQFAEADIAPEAGDLAHYIHRARRDDELTRLSGSRWVPAIVAERAGRNPALILASGTPRSAGAPMPEDDRRGIPDNANSVTGNAMDNDNYNVMDTVVSAIRFGNRRLDVALADWTTIEGRFGDLMIRASGTFTYTLNGEPITADEEVFHYTLSSITGGSGEARIIIDFTLDPDGGTGGGGGGGGGDGGGDGGPGGGGGGGDGGGGDGDGGGGSGGGDNDGDGNSDGDGNTGGNGGSGGSAEGISKDYENVSAMMSNLLSNDVLPKKAPEIYANDQGDIRLDGAPLYMAMRSLTAKRSVAMNSLASIIGQRIAGEPESAPFLKRMIAELGVPEADVDLIVGKNPSYFAQMEVLTKKAYQNPVFYTELYDKRANLRRKDAALKAIGLMQDRDIYQSLLRSEMVGSILLETMLMEKQIQLRDRVVPKDGTGNAVIKGGQ